MTIIHTPGHTQDELAWYDHDEMHVYVGDSLYEEGSDGMPIEFTAEGNFLEWAFAMHKIQYLIRGENARAAAKATEVEDGWCSVPRRVKLAAGHQTHSADAESFLDIVGQFWWDALAGKVPAVKKEYLRGDAYFTWREKDGGKAGLSLKAPARLMDEARKFFEGTGVFVGGCDFPG